MSIWNFPLFPKQASSYAWHMDFMYFVLTALSVFFFVAVTLVLIYFGIKYRKGSSADRTLTSPDNNTLELAWTIIPTIMALAMFVWATLFFFHVTQPPADSMEIFVVGKQWMWKIQHPEGQREINELHVPVGQNVKLTMTSQDVIHDFFIPEFRTKADVVPGKYTTQWFRATVPGEYHIFCAQYCGTEHSGMVGRVVAMKPEDYETWLRGSFTGLTPTMAGEQLFQKLGCVSCHMTGDTPRGPRLTGIMGTEVKLQNGQMAKVDEEYIRESILYPNAKQVFGFPLLMPTFDGQLSQEEILELIAYIKSLATPAQSSK